ncbi:MAG: YqgE/AlgH family protein [Gammaproteobacteria bacterium]|nr:YqgE/AlgH family protein [Gammaproteobacteria bacterium]MDH5511821.1 YqgE/AlgH family protein [Gammaproteobacteria bacterium]
MKGPDTLANHFLIAMPSLADANFARSVTLICEHSEEGSMGIVINRLTDLHLSEIFDQLGINPDNAGHADDVVYLGGPVQNNRGFVLHEPLGEWESTLSVTDRFGVSTSRDILEAIAENRGPEKFIVALGYAGWGAGQLEREISENSWLSGPASRDIIFDLPVEQRWKAAAGLVGVDLATLSGEAGHA